MRIRLRHDLHFTWDRPVRSVLQSLRVTPRDHEAQHITDWRVSTDIDCRLQAGEDAFGNLTHTCDADGPLTELTLTLEGLVHTSDFAGVVRNAVERFSPSLYLRDTPLTTPDPALRAFADAAAKGAKDPLDTLHRLMGAVHEAVALAKDAASPLVAAQSEAGAALAAKSASVSDISHVMIAAARHLGLPARYVAGYFVAEKDAEPHGWMEAYAPEIGWIGFDPVYDICPQEAHLRVAIGLDMLATLPVRSAPSGFAAESMESKLKLLDRVVQAQSQSQG